jgi:hypothetical protein
MAELIRLLRQGAPATRLQQIDFLTPLRRS